MINKFVGRRLVRLAVQRNLTRSDTSKSAWQRIRYYLALLWFLSASSFAVDSLDTIIIDSGVDEPIRIAIVPFAMPAQNTLPASLSEVSPIEGIISFDLARSGQFAPLAAENMLSYPTDRKGVFFRDWRILKTNYLVIGRVQIDPTGAPVIDFEMYDIALEQRVLAFGYTVRADQWRDAAHAIADQIYTHVTGVRGAFSSKILYVLAQNSGTAKATYRLEIADADGARSRTLFASKEPILSASWSPDGRRVSYVSFETGRPSIILQDVAGPYREQLTNFKGINGSPMYSPDGSQLAMVLSRDGDPEVFVMDLDTRRLRRVTRHHAIDTEPSWSPLGDKLIFTSDRGGRPQIYQIDLTTNFLERLTFVGDYNARARYLPDGQHLVYVHRQDGVFHIAWQDLQRGNVTVLTRTSLDESPSLAPNGAMLIYATQDRGRGILAVVSVDGRVKYRLPSSAGDVREPAWSPFLSSNMKPYPLN